MGGWSFWDEVYEVLAGRNLYLDTSNALPYMAQRNGKEANPRT